MVGALPFDPDTAPVLLAPESFQRHAGAPRWKTAPLVPDVVDISQRPSLQEHGRRVSRAVEAIGRGEFQKVVLSREEEYTLASPVEPEALLRGFMETSATGHGHLVATTNGPEEAFFVGSSPELLIRKEGARIVSHPLAGTIARSEDPVTDWARAIELTLSHKDIAEHRFVTTAIRKVLEPLCTQLHVPELPTLTATSHTWHLGTHIEGTLRNPDTSVLELAALLHPTPAVNGAPSAAALDFLRQQEPERGLYGGAIGYADSHGDGEWRVAIRSATVQGSQVSARAGGGIVAESQPDQEIEETNFKLGPVRALLGLAAKGDTEGTAQPPSAHIAPNPEPHLSPLNGSHGPEVLANHMPRTLAQEYHRQGIWTHHTHWDVFQQTVATFPNRPATTDGHRSLSWHELDNSVETAAHYLHQAGVRRGDGCILQLPNSVVFLETLLALWKLGAIPIFALPDLGSTEVRHFASHALQAGVVLIASPVRGRGAGNGESITDEFSAGQVRSAAQVLPHDFALAVAVFVYRQFRSAHFDAGSFSAFALVLNEFELKRLVGFAADRVFFVNDHAVEGLPFLHNPLGLLLDRFEVFRRKRFFHLEVIVETVGDVRADTEFGTWVQFLNRLCDDVRARVAQNVEPVWFGDEDRFNRVTRLQFTIQIGRSPVEANSDNFFAPSEELRGCHAVLEIDLFTVEGHDVCHVCLLSN